MKKLPLEKQVITPDQAKEFDKIFKKAGSEPPESLWVWARLKYGNIFGIITLEKYEYENEFYNNEKYPAYTGDEIGVLLPTEIINEKRRLYFRLKKVKIGWLAKYESIPRLAHLGFRAENKISVQAKAALAIQGLKEGWIKPEDFKYT